ncbi:hypothetical protein DRO54_08875 [Candidatus Bathyarchaeota archaeon]|nr:MAG: hypothetical protein DRO54_08875 [Candidatus Bathyarchaeota archaeon]
MNHGFPTKVEREPKKDTMRKSSRERQKYCDSEVSGIGPKCTNCLLSHILQQLRDLNEAIHRGSEGHAQSPE